MNDVMKPVIRLALSILLLGAFAWSEVGGKDREIGAGIGCGACGVEGRDGNPMALTEGRRAADRL